MSHFVDAVIDVIVYVCGWRVLLCFGLAAGLACLLAAYDVFLFYPRDISVVVAIVGLILGFCWEVRARESPS
jgi:hypothetical protein